MKILIVEDNDGDQTLLKEAFQLCEPSIELTFVSNAEDAGALLQKAKTLRQDGMPQVILLDLNLPKKGGKDFLRELKADSVLCKIPVMALTSSRAEADISECYALGASCYLKKPMRFADLENMVSALCKFWDKEVSFVKF
jgi:two-component system response regulator